MKLYFKLISYFLLGLLPGLLFNIIFGARLPNFQLSNLLIYYYCLPIIANSGAIRYIIKHPNIIENATLNSFKGVFFLNGLIIAIGCNIWYFYITM